MDFSKSIFENVKEKGMPFVVAHRGVSGANIPCNTVLSYQIAVDIGTEVVEIDVTKSKDGKYFVFHPGMEHVFLKCGKNIPDMTAEEVLRQPLLNLDELPTHYRVPTLEEVLLFLKNKAYINIDKFWTDIEGITNIIRKCGVEKQVIIKTPVEERYFAEIERVAPDLMYMSVVRYKDNISEDLLCRNINYIGVEALFEKKDDKIASKKYIDEMHEKGLLVWANSIIYDENDVISAGFTDDESLLSGGDAGWGRIIDLGFDFIQTDWLPVLQKYLTTKLQR